MKHVIFQLKPTYKPAIRRLLGFLRPVVLAEKLPAVFHKYPPTPNPAILQAGFTVLELLVVIALLGAVSIATLTLVVDTHDIESQGATEQRWHEIRKAIIGDSTLSLNGEPYISGYVADMGRLPSNIQELFIQGTQPTWAATNLNTIEPELTGAISGGWRGPYLYTAGSQFYRDGWGNVDASPPLATNDDVNFGWKVSLTGASPMLTAIAVQSLGGDNAPNGNEFNEDFPNPLVNIVNANEWQQTSALVIFNVIFNKPPNAPNPPPPPTPPAALTNLELRLYFIEDTTVEEAVSTTKFNLLFSDPSPNLQSVDVNVPLLMGRYAAVIWCSAEEQVYDGDCLGQSNKQPYYFTLLPNAHQPITIRWNIP